MISKLKRIISYAKPYKPSPVEQEFTQLNNQYWNNEKTTVAENSYCLIEGQITCPASIMDKARIGKAVQEVTGATPVVFLRGFYKESNDVAHIYKSFNINNFYMWWKGFLNPLVFIPALFATLKTVILYKDGNKLANLKHKGVEIGELIYDTLIRFKPNTYTINQIKFTHYRLIFRAFLTFYNNEYLIRKYKPKYLVTSHNVYAEFGMLPRQLKKVDNTNVIFLKDIYAYKCYNSSVNIKEHFLKPSIELFNQKLSSPEYLEEARAYVENRFNGNIDQIDVKNAFLNKKTYSLDELKEIFPKVDKNKKNIVVMSHAFSDAPHVGEGLLFNDYYDFLVKTLIHLNENKEVNTFVKAHPSSYMWNEKGAVEELLEKYQLDNIYILPNNLNTNSIVNFADYIVTAKGTAGLEFSCLGIPAVTAGKGYYYGFGITKEPDTVEEYYSILDSITKIDKLDDETINRALVLLYMVAQSRRHSKILPKSHIMPGEIYSEVYLDKYKEIIENFKKGEAMKDSFYDEIKKDVVNSSV